MNSVDRILMYMDNAPQERPHFLKDREKPKNWPNQGIYQVRNMRYKYRPDLPEVIKGINFDIEKYQKIGVIGRTGSGKSTMTLGFLRILELLDEKGIEKGSIILDGQNIENIGLNQLRHSCAMIPQDPVLFVGTVKSNIDPFGYYKDEDIIAALKKVQLYESILTKIDRKPEEIVDKDVLNVKVENEGSNFSQGERQLICMVRVLIKNPKVLLMDEATASIDEKTDYFIQSMIKTEFKETTIITIAHRLNTIIQYDKILVLAEGNLVAYDSPMTMLNDKTSYLWKLVSDQGKEFEKKMMYLAENREANLN